MNKYLKFLLFAAIALADACSMPAPALAQSVSLNPVALVHGVKTGFTQKRGFHRFVFGAELLGASISLGADGGTTEYVNAHSRLWNAACGCYVQAAHETDPLFLAQGTHNLSQVRLWLWKGALAAAPFGLSAVSHKFAPDSNALDAALVGVIGGADAYYLKAAIDNLKIAAQIERENKAAGH